MDAYTLLGFIVPLALVMAAIVGAHFPTWAVQQKIRNAYKKSLARHYTQGDAWICVKKTVDKDDGLLGSYAREIILERYGGRERLCFVYDGGVIQEGSTVLLRMREDNDRPAESFYPPFGDVLVPVLLGHPPRRHGSFDGQ